jgi:hypothetical protein
MGYGRYYLRSDELCGRAGVFGFGDLCFVSERDAISAGYERGPR